MNKKFGVFIEPGTVQFERLLPGPVERIWDYLTKSELKGKWLASGDVEPKADGKVEFRFQHKNLSKQDDSIPEKYKAMEDGTYFEGRVLKYEPYQLLSYTWGEETGEESVVTYELIPKKNDKVLLRLTHRKLGDNPTTLMSVGAGWHTHLDILGDVLIEKEPEGFWKIHMPLEKEYSKIVSNRPLNT